MRLETRGSQLIEQTSFPESFYKPIQQASKEYILRLAPYERRPNGDFAHVTLVYSHQREPICTIRMYPSTSTKLPSFHVIYEIVSPDREITYGTFESKSPLSPLNVEELRSQIASAIADVQEYPNSQTRRVHE